MANGYFKRGEIYWIQQGDAIGHELKSGRPGLIVSSERGNETSPVVNIVMLTTQRKSLSINPYSCVNGVPRWALCNQLYTVDKERLLRYEGELCAYEMEEVDKALQIALGLTNSSRSESEIAKRDKEIEDLKAELASVVSESAKRNEEIDSLKMEIEMWQKCYGRCLDMLVETKVNADLSHRTVGKSEEPVVEDPVVEDPVVEDPVVEDPGYERVNINTASAQEIHDATGLSITVCYGITGVRKREGLYKSVNDLLRVPRFSESHLEKYGAMMEV
jgi:mRNA-degrading endonuclease toxin of MazEF toxin-antitoxin module